MNDKKHAKAIPLAHRGCFDKGPENTMPAFEEAVQCGMGGLEIDIRRTRDGEIVVFHDDTAERLTRGYHGVWQNVPIAELTLSQVKQIRLPYGGHLLQHFPKDGFRREMTYYCPWELMPAEEIREWEEQDHTVEELQQLYKTCDSKYEKAVAEDGRTAQILTLEEFLTWLGRQPETFLAEIEYKDYGMTAEVVRLLEKTGTFGRCILFSGVIGQVEEMQRWFQKNGLPDGLRLGANIRWYNDEMREQIRDWQLYEVGLNADAFMAEDVKRLNDRGIRIFSNLGDYPQWWEKLDSLGVDAFKTNTGKMWKKFKTSNTL